MTAEEIVAYCMTKEGAYVDHPFGPEPVCLKVRGHIFAQVYPSPQDLKVTLKCEPLFGDFYRMQYPGDVARGYHCPPVQQPYWNTVRLNRTVPDGEVRIMIDQAYRAVVKKLTRAEREGLGEGEDI